MHTKFHCRQSKYNGSSVLYKHSWAQTPHMYVDSYVHVAHLTYDCFLNIKLNICSDKRMNRQTDQQYYKQGIGGGLNYTNATKTHYSSEANCEVKVYPHHTQRIELIGCAKMLKCKLYKLK